MAYDRSSYFPSHKTSMDERLTGPSMSTPPTGNAGYNRQSYFDAGRVAPLRGAVDEEEMTPKGDVEEAWDVYGDFNNTGPKYSTAFTSQTQTARYQPIGSQDDRSSAAGPVEMVTVPALGAEWGREELRNMTKAGKSEKKAESRRAKWKAWNRGETGICGDFLHRRTFVFVMFAICVAIGITVAFTIPRVPAVSFTSTPLQNATGSWNSSIPTLFSRYPANFSFPAQTTLTLETTSSYVPLHFKSFTADIYDLSTDKLVATGSVPPMTLPAKSFPNVVVPLNFSYSAINTSDSVWSTYYDACRNAAFYTDNQRPGVDFTLQLTFSILGLIGTRSTSATVTGVACPIELSINAA